MTRSRPPFPLPFAALALAAAAFSLPARAGKQVSFFLEPILGYTAVTLNALEVENKFVTSSPDEDDPTAEDDWSEVDPAIYQTPVGRRAYYEGGGFSCGGAAGIRLFAVQIGVTYVHDGVRLEGFSKRYRYSAEDMQATGRKIVDEGDAAFQRLLVLLRYILPFWKLQLELTTRLGAVFIDEGPLIVGRAVEQGSGFAGDVGVGLGLSPVKLLTLRVTGTYGFFSYTGDYEGTYGMIGGFAFAIGLSI
jgi:hypothetical protein